jgi:type III restriction enzyme
MNLQFEHNLDYQRAAIDAVCSLFTGQELCRTEFTVSHNATRLAAGTDLAGQVLQQQMGLGLAESELGIGNRLSLLDDDLLKNLNAVQLRNGLALSPSLESGDFTVEMETGTGKTYVYLRTLFELNQKFGFTKFVIVVPSVAIKEGVYKSLQIMAPHYKTLYAGVPFDYFLYDSAKPGPVRNFATSPHMQIMVVTVGAINKKDVNNLYKESEKTGGEKPIDLIRATRPIVVVDEPQSVDGGLQGSGKQALEAMGPLCTLRYSATHATKHHMVYKLDAVDAYERQLVKQIEVASLAVEGGHNRPYVKLLGVGFEAKKLIAEVELDVQAKTGTIKRTPKKVRMDDDLQQVTGNAMYADYMVGEVSAKAGAQYIDLRFPGGEEQLAVGQAVGDVDDDAIKRMMIKRTIREHLDKELRLRPKGIKVLSLFFIDTVANYRLYSDDGIAAQGKFAQMFEEEYTAYAQSNKYKSLFKEVDLTAPASGVHDGYFSIDKKGGWTDTGESNQTGRDSAERAYNLIMKDKERLLSFDTPLKFIFSHSALREGWDNPNVFQICNLREINTERERRQTIGRGLRLCVDQTGQRLRGFDVNTLTVIANESYEDFADKLQKEMEADTGIRFGMVEGHAFAQLAVASADGDAANVLGAERSEAMARHLKALGLIDAKGKVQDSLRKALKDGTVPIPPELQAWEAQIIERLRKLAGKLDIKNADDKKAIALRREVYLSPDFKALWDRIKHRTTYRVAFDNAQLLDTCVKAMQEAPKVTPTRARFRKADLSIGRGGVAAESTTDSVYETLHEKIPLPDLLTELQDRTQLTRRSLVDVLQRSGRLDDFKVNPQQFIDLAAQFINRYKQHAIVDGIRYTRLGDAHVWAQELFETTELLGYLNTLQANKSVFESVLYDSEIERSFADALERNESVKLYVKLPSWFKIPTPLGSYNPDWAVVIDHDGQEKLYFVVETKGSLVALDLRTGESDKIDCGAKHFEALAVGQNPANFKKAKKLEDVLGLHA